MVVVQVLVQQQEAVHCAGFITGRPFGPLLISNVRLFNDVLELGPRYAAPFTGFGSSIVPL